MKKLKKVRIKHLRSDEWGDFDCVNFAFCSKDSKQASNFHLCRENLVNEVFNFYNKNPYTQDINPRKMKLLVQRYFGDDRDYSEDELDQYKEDFKNFQKETERWMRRGLKLINHFEKIAKWQPTELYEASHKTLGEIGISMYLFVGPGKWMRSPHMISLFAFLIRIGSFKEWDSLKSQKSFEEISKRLIKRNRDPEIYYEEADYDTSVHLKDIHEKITTLVKNFDKLFGKKPSRHFFTTAIPNPKSRYGEGISRLCRGNASDEETNKAFRRLLEENK